MKLMLVRVSTDAYFPPQQRRPRLEHLGLGYLAACLRQKGQVVEIVDAELERLSETQVMARLTEADCDLVGFTMPDAVSARAATEFLARWEQPGKRGRQLHLTAGGQWATLSARKLFEIAAGLDSVVLYEGEETLPDLAQRLAEKRDWRATPGMAYKVDGCLHESDPRPRLANLDELPFPARDTVPALLSADPNAALSVLSSRGCHRRCTFCSVGRFFGNWRARSAGNVVDELGVLVKDLRATHVDFQDDNFLGPGERGRERATAIAELMRKRRLQLRFRFMCSADTVTYDVLSRLVDAGLYSVFIGIESGSQARLTAYRKGTVQQNIRALEVLDRLGILPMSEIGFIMFHPDADLKEVQQNLAFLREHVRFITPGTLLNGLDCIYSCDEAPPSWPEPLRLLRELFALVAAATRDAYQRLDLGRGHHTETWRLGVLDIATHATNTLSALVESKKLTDDAYQAIVAEVRLRAQALASDLLLMSQGELRDPPPVPLEPDIRCLLE